MEMDTLIKTIKAKFPNWEWFDDYAFIWQSEGKNTILCEFFHDKIDCFRMDGNTIYHFTYSYENKRDLLDFLSKRLDY